MALNTKEVVEFLHGVRRKSYKLGLMLGITTDHLDTIKVTNEDPGDYLIEVIKIWLKSVHSFPTWKALGDALATETVDETELSRKGKTKGYRIYQLVGVL